VWQRDIVDEIGLQRDWGALSHQPHSVGEPGRAERRLRLVGIKRRQPPPALLPPHCADQEPKGAVGEMLDAALARHGPQGISGNPNACEHQEPEYPCRRGRLQQEHDYVQKWIGTSENGLGLIGEVLSSYGDSYWTARPHSFNWSESNGTA